ncbi:hypothetical protein WMF31_36565 [Sorangium sp. So ce1036]
MCEIAEMCGGNSSVCLDDAGRFLDAFPGFLDEAAWFLGAFPEFLDGTAP